MLKGKLDTGKVAGKILEEIVFNKATPSNKEILEASGIGEDCAVISTENEYCLLSTDPITGATKDIGYLAVHVNANDIAACGGEPLGILVTVLMPEGTEALELQDIMDGVYNACEELGLSVIGGHSEVTDAVNRVVVCATVVGKTQNKKFLRTKDAKPGQDLIMTKFAGLEGTTILAKEFEAPLTEKFGSDFVQSADRLASMLSVLKESRIAVKHGATAMHDITEGGVMGAAYEMAVASGVGAELYLDLVPLLPETKQICDYFNINPYKLISSGSMLIASNNGGELVEKLKDQGINAAVIGKFTENNLTYIQDEKIYSLTSPETDELYKALNQA